MTQDRRASRTAGFSLIEALVALALLSIALGGIIPVFVSYSAINLQSEVRSNAVFAAEKALDELRATPFSSWSSAGGATTISAVENVGGRNYTVTSVWSSYGGLDNSREVTTAVVYKGKEYFQATTVFTELED